MIISVLACVFLLLAGCGSKDAARAPEKAEHQTASPGGAADTLIWFEDVAQRSGLDFRHVSGHRERPYFPEIMGGGAALLDMDDDGDLDLHLVQGGSLYEPGSDAGRDRLYRNRGDGTFDDVTEGSGADDRGYGMGCAVGDYDEDGDPDLYVTNFGPDTLLRNDGGGKFTDVTKEAGVGDPAWGTSATFADLDADGDLDLYVANYVNWTMANEIDCPNSFGQLDYCLPTNYKSPARDTLYRNDGGRFTDVSDAAGLGADLAYGLGVVATDFDSDGRIDVFVANDSVFNQLWMNQGGLRFVNEALMRGCAVDENGTAKAGMGTTAIDLDLDLDRDLLVVNLFRQSDSYFENEGGFFTDRTARVGLGAVSRGLTRFGTGIFDFDHDGILDLYTACGRVEAALEPETEDPYAEPSLLLRGKSVGTFEAVTPIGGTKERRPFTSRGAAFGDVNGDGGVDIVVVNRDGPVQLLRNARAGRGHWILVRARERSGRDALGAAVTLTAGGRTIARDVISGSSYCAANDPRVHVGLGSVSRVDDVTVTWVGGEKETFGSFDADRVVELRRGAGKRAGT